MSANLESTIKSIDLIKGEIIINGINNNQDIYCKKYFYEQCFSEKELEILTVGTKVSFNITEKGNCFYANSLEIISVTSTIKSIKENLIINKVSEQQEKDFVCSASYYEKTLNEEQISKLKVGDRVSFKPIVNEKGYFAQNLVIHSKPSNHIEDESKVVLKAINTKELADELNNKISNSFEHIKKGDEFEDFCLFIFRLLGVSELYAIPRNNAAGKPDGMFKVYNASTNTPRLEVIYDCTLNTEWEKIKEVQLKNYVNQICNEYIQIEYTYQSHSIDKNIKEKILLSSNADKQIWVVTKNKSRTISKEQIKVKENEISISIKEISIIDLISLTYKKYLDHTYTRMDELADKLKNLGSN
ncbi:hypothetical protein [Mannheimia indoligenes]|uniref:hypothetical protein n=1 Tax=Mannheimia indoligenes TaxID=3103145 RepID=UPI002FE658B9